jgi:translation elongation factor P/translation initiation factor 5A
VATIMALDLQVGLAVLGNGGELLRVEDRELRPPTPISLLVRLTLRDVETGLVHRAVYLADAAVEVALLPERDLECLYLTDSGCVLCDPASGEQHEVPPWVSVGLTNGPRPSEHLLGGFWRGRPVTLRRADLTPG